MNGLKTLPIGQIHESPLNPRKKFDAGELAELADSIRSQGILQPLTARPNDDGYELVIGARRYRAAVLVGLAEVPVIVRELTDEETLEIMLIENDQRSNVAPLEEADAILRLATQFGRSTEHIADKIGRSEDFVRRRMTLGRLAAPLRRLLDTERIGIGSAELLASLPDAVQLELAGGELSEDSTGYQGPTSWTRHQVSYAIRRCLRELRRAPWDLEADLGPRACVGCPARTSSQMVLGAEFAEGDDRCLNSACWTEKLAAYVDQERAAGVEVLTDEEADAAGRHNAKGFVRLDRVTYDVEGAKTYQDLVDEDTPQVLALTAHGPVRLVRAEVFTEVIERKHPELADKLSGKANRAAQAEAREAAKLERARIDARIGAIVDEAVGGEWSGWLPLFVDGAITVLNQDPLLEVCKRRGWEVPKGEFTKHPDRAVRDAAQQMTQSDLMGLLAELLCRTPVERVERGHDYNGGHRQFVDRLTALLSPSQPDDNAAAGEPVVCHIMGGGELLCGADLEVDDGSVWAPSRKAAARYNTVCEDCADVDLAYQITHRGYLTSLEDFDGYTVKRLRSLLVDRLNVKRGDTTKKTRDELIELIRLYAETETCCAAARAAARAEEE